MDDKKYLLLSLYDNDQEDQEDVLVDQNGDTNDDFTIKYIATDGWRGYYTAKPNSKDWQEVDSDWITSNWSDAGDNASDTVEEKLDQMAHKYESKGKQMAVIFLQTSNVFSTNYQVFIK